MLFMVIEHIPDLDAVAERFAQAGRLLPHGVKYIDSWGEPEGGRFFQLLEAEAIGPVEAWALRWSDLMTIEILPVLASRDFWARHALSGGLDPFEESRGG